MLRVHLARSYVDTRVDLIRKQKKDHQIMSLLGFNAAPSSAPVAPAVVVPQPPTFIQKITTFCATATADREASHGVEHSKSSISKKHHIIS